MEGLGIELWSWFSKELIDAKLTPIDTSLSIYCFKATRCDTIIIGMFSMSTPVSDSLCTNSLYFTVSVSFL